MFLPFPASSHPSVQAKGEHFANVVSDPTQSMVELRQADPPFPDMDTVGHKGIVDIDWVLPRGPYTFWSFCPAQKKYRSRQH